MGLFITLTSYFLLLTSFIGPQSDTFGDAGNIATAKRAVELRLAGDDGGVRIGHDDFHVVKSERLCLRFAHGLELVLKIGDAVGIHGNEIR
jgi:hypothetical protein